MHIFVQMFKNSRIIFQIINNKNNTKKFTQLIPKHSKMSREVTRVFENREMGEGRGARVRRSIGNHDVN
jgi:hypothetical protein